MIAARLALDALAIAVLVYGIYLPRHRRTDLAVIYAVFSVGLCVALVVITRGEVTLGVGLGLFAVLSMVRLRSETYSNRELAYFFAALVIAVVSAVDIGSLGVSAALIGVVLVAAWAVDHPRWSRPARRMDVTLEMVFDDQEALRRQLEERLKARVLDAWVLEMDYVRETTRAAVRYEPSLDAAVAAPRR